MANSRIWFDPGFSLARLEKIEQEGLGYFLGIRFSMVADDFIEATMPVCERTRQPLGLLHGGASAALAETIGSVGSAFIIDQEKYRCVGLEINANHLFGAKEGTVTARAKPLHIGRSTHVWDIRIFLENGKLVCVSRLTVAIIPRST